MRKCLFSVENPFKDCGVNILKVKGVIFTYIFKKYIFLDHYFIMIGQIRADRKQGPRVGIWTRDIVAQQRYMTAFYPQG